ncbi:tol-pal system protein YbgF [Kineobactrum sediminis]|uniref:Cell division coordinator CpoB n=1 Tax=Kineobactrum sediminis TaxID=1905677 RepID=A0A2N5Y6L5_9GAMM|nr:tol-pal system protein YbgF [Kineobactrum sediminis]PLW84044.1 tol-pal system protein YbgF [Kineobactrum sediminis]
MRYISKALIANGLALAVGPFCIAVQAQDYIDVEAERAAAAETQPAGRADPYGAKPAQSYPTTSYGIGAAAGTQSQSAANNNPQANMAVADRGGNAGQLLLQVQQLQQEVMRLNGLVEEQGHEIRMLKEKSLERYLDLDRRISLLSGGEAGAGLPVMPPAGSAAVEPVASANVGNNAPVEQPGEAQAYQAAYSLVKAQQFDGAVQAFQQFLRDYPAGRFTPNAHYWLGELYLVTTPADMEASRQSFMLLLDLYPNDSKVPDALFKLGRIHYDKGNRERAREFFDRVIQDFGTSRSAAVKLAQDFIRENY